MTWITTDHTREFPDDEPEDVMEATPLAVRFYHQDQLFAAWCREMAILFPASRAFYIGMAKDSEKQVRDHERVYGKEAA